MTTRRDVLALASAAALPARRHLDVETRIARREFRGLTKDQLGTPALILDLDLFERNLRAMADHSKATGINLRPHVKIHKVPEISRRQVALGALGVCCATIAECELLNASGVRNVLFTCQPGGTNKIARAAALAKRDPGFMVVADDPRTVDWLDEAAAAQGVRMNVFTDVFAGLTRQGIQPGAPALALSQRIVSKKNLKFAGLMAYSGDASHTKGFEARRERSKRDLAGMLETAALCKKSGIDVPIRTGGSTGTYNIDVGSLTELQCGSYIFMDTLYKAVGGKSNPASYDDFGGALTVMTTVVSKTRPNQCAIDAGNKAMLRTTDEVKGRPGVKIENQGAEYGMLLWNNGDRDIDLGERVEIYPSNLDTSVNVYDRIHVARGEDIVDVWAIMGRKGAAQR